MPEKTRIVAPGPSNRSVTTQEGQVLDVPADWELLPPGDAALTRRVKSGGSHWLVQEKKGRRVFSRGVWAPSDRIETIRANLAVERSGESFQRRKAAAEERRHRQQKEYVLSFQQAVLEFLDFAPRYTRVAERLAQAVSDHATPVGSGTVARTQRIPIEQRAESAVIAWMRHQTTAYDSMKIPRVRGKRRDVRRMLAQRSKQLLSQYRTGDELSPHCPLKVALQPADAG